MLGARPLRRTVQREIEDTLAEKMLYGEVGPGQIVLVDVEGEGAEATFTFQGNAEERAARPAADRGAGRDRRVRARLTGPRADEGAPTTGRRPRRMRAAVRGSVGAVQVEHDDAADDHQQREPP